MKTFRQLFAVIVITLMIAVPSFAGNMHTTAPTTPPPDPAPVTTGGETSTNFHGETQTGNSDEATASEAVAADVLSLVQIVLSLL